jgi:hypothetical protein
MTGDIVGRDQTISIGGPPTVHVKANPTDECGIVFRVSSNTRLLRRTTSGPVVSASVSEFTVGQRVNVWWDVTFRSCPGQAVADVLEILE